MLCKIPKFKIVFNKMLTTFIGSFLVSGRDDSPIEFQATYSYFI